MERQNIKLRVHVVKPLLLQTLKSSYELELQSLWPCLDPQIVAQIENTRLTIYDCYCDLLVGLDKYYEIISYKTTLNNSGEYATIQNLFEWSKGENTEFSD